MPAREIIVDSFAGGGGASTGIEMALGRSPDIAINHDETALAMHAINHPETLHIVEDVWSVDPRQAVGGRPVGLLWASPDCFPAGTLVLTAEGYRPIEEVEVGDAVLTHRCRWRAVTETSKALRPLVSVRGHGHPGLLVSPEHPFLARRRADVWQASPRGYRRSLEPQDWVPASMLDRGWYWAAPVSFPSAEAPPVGGRGIAIDENFMWMLRRARKYMRNGEGEGTQWTKGYAGRVMEWALSLKPAKQGLGHGATAQDAPVIGHLVTDHDAAGVTDDGGGALAGAVIQPADPIIRALVEAKCNRKAWPAGHTFGMTNPIVNGQMVTLGTCTCGHYFSFAWGSYERMDAAIEAHWQKFDHLPEKIDGRGQPIVTSVAGMTAKKRKRKPSPDQGLFDAATAAADAAGPASGPAPSSLSGAGDIEPASIDAGSTGRLDDLGSVQDGRKMSTDGQPALGDSAGAELRDCASPQATAAPAPALSAIMEMLAGALRCAATGLPSGERTTIRFTDEWEHLGSRTISDILDLANEILEAAPQAELVSPPRRRQAAQICASDDNSAAWANLPPEVRAQAEADGTDELLKAALSLTWKEPEPPIRKPKGPIQLPDGRLVGPEEYTRELVKQKLNNELPHPGPLFGSSPPLDDNELMEVET